VRGTGVYGGIFWTLQSSIAELRAIIDAKIKIAVFIYLVRGGLLTLKIKL
jgi:hypothetical protein